MEIELKGGHTTEDPRLDRIYQLDLRSLNYPVRQLLIAGEERKPRSYTWSVGIWLDQGAEGACVGFGFSHELAGRPVSIAGVTEKFAREKVYWEAQRLDDWPGGSYPQASPRYEGTSVLAGAKVLTNMGYYSSYHWGITTQELASGIGYTGPAVLGLNWHRGMFTPDQDGFLWPTGGIAGGHCILAYGVSIKFSGLTGWLMRDWSHVDLERSYIKVWNSWGATWGQNGSAKISLYAMQKLLEGEHGEALFPQRGSRKPVV